MASAVLGSTENSAISDQWSKFYFGLNAKPKIQILNVIYLLYQKSLGQIFDRQT